MPCPFVKHGLSMPQPRSFPDPAVSISVLVVVSPPFFLTNATIRPESPWLLFTLGCTVYFTDSKHPKDIFSPSAGWPYPASRIPYPVIPGRVSHYLVSRSPLSGVQHMRDRSISPVTLTGSFSPHMQSHLQKKAPALAHHCCGGGGGGTGRLATGTIWGQSQNMMRPTPERIIDGSMAR